MSLGVGTDILQERLGEQGSHGQSEYTLNCDDQTQVPEFSWVERE